LRNNSLNLAHIGQRKDKLNHITKECPEIGSVYEIYAGKFRRYNGESWFVRLFDLKTWYFNIRDFFRLIIGTFQSWRLLGKIKPRVIFVKGGFVGVPVGFAARIRGIPYVTHDSDAMISLANKLISSHATLHLTAMPPEYYEGYEQEKTIQVGIPIRSVFKKIDNSAQNKAKTDLGYKIEDNLILVMGGGLGSRKINKAVIESANQILDNANTKLILITGYKLLGESEKYLQNRIDHTKAGLIKLIPFSKEIEKLGAAADLIVMRAGATNLAEFSAQGKACILVPNPLLTGGHQLKNTVVYKSNGAVIEIAEENLATEIAPVVKDLFTNPDKLVALSKKISQHYITDSSKKIADQLFEIAKFENSRTEG